jgi:hypothetical protein
MSNEQPVIDSDGGVTMPGVEGWRFFPRPTPAQVGRAYESVEPFRADSNTWVDFVNMVTSSLYFEDESGWLRFDNFHAGASTELHGSTFDRRGDPTRDYTVRQLLDFLIHDGNLVCINCMVPEHNTMAIGWLKRIGFIPTGVIPAYNSWGGQPRSLVIYSYMRGN